MVEFWYEWRMSIINLSPTQLRQAADLKEKIANLNQQLAALFRSSAAPAPGQPAKPVLSKKRGMSAAGKAKVAAAQKLRWAKIHAAKSVAAKPAHKKGKISPEGMARIIAASKARWARVRAAQAAKKK